MFRIVRNKVLDWKKFMEIMQTNAIDQMGLENDLLKTEKVDIFKKFIDRADGGMET